MVCSLATVCGYQNGLDSTAFANAAGFGSSVCVTAPFGLFAAAEVLKFLAAGAR